MFKCYFSRACYPHLDKGSENLKKMSISPGILKIMVASEEVWVHAIQGSHVEETLIEKTMDPQMASCIGITYP